MDRINEYLDEINDSAFEEKHIRPDGFTVMEYMEEIQRGRSQAKARLRKLVAAGKLGIQKWYNGQAVVNIYSFTD